MAKIKTKQNGLNDDILYCLNNCTHEDIYQHLLETSKDFIPKLSKQKDIYKYSKKIYKNADTFVFKKDGKIIALLACYNNMNKTAFMTIVSVSNKYRKKGYASILLQKAIDFSKNKGMVKVGLEVHMDNIPSQKLAKKYNFKKKFIKEDIIVMELIFNE